jgi:hypothetical protein
MAASAASRGQGTKRNFVVGKDTWESFGEGEELRDELVSDEAVDIWQA